MTTDLDLLNDMAVDEGDQHPLSQASLTAVRMADLGARAGALGLERGAVTKMVTGIQAAARAAALEVLERALEDVMNVVEARLNRVLQETRALPEKARPTSPPGLLGPFMRPDPPVESLVSRDQVLATVMAAMLEKPAR